MTTTTYLIIIPKDFDIEEYMENSFDWSYFLDYDYPGISKETFRKEIISEFRILKQTGSLGEHYSDMFEEILKILKTENFIFSEIDGCSIGEDIIICIGDENTVYKILSILVINLKNTTSDSDDYSEKEEESIEGDDENIVPDFLKNKED